MLTTGNENSSEDINLRLSTSSFADSSCSVVHEADANHSKQQESPSEIPETPQVESCNASKESNGINLHITRNDNSTLNETTSTTTSSNPNQSGISTASSEFLCNRSS